MPSVAGPWLFIGMGVACILVRRPYARLINEHNRRWWKLDVGEKPTERTIMLVGCATILLGAWLLFHPG